MTNWDRLHSFKNGYGWRSETKEITIYDYQLRSRKLFWEDMDAEARDKLGNELLAIEENRQKVLAKLDAYEMPPFAQIMMPIIRSGYKDIK